MGYYTHYSLDWDEDVYKHVMCPNCGEKTLKVDAIEEEFLNLPHIAVHGCFAIADFFEESLKWYSHEDDMRALSEKFPEVLFTLGGEGEESGDIWLKYFRNGKMQAEKMDRPKFPAFDERKAK